MLKKPVLMIDDLSFVTSCIVLLEAFFLLFIHILFIQGENNTETEVSFTDVPHITSAKTKESHLNYAKHIFTIK